MRIATWNVNSVRTRLDQVLAWLQQERPEVLCLQETKVTDELFPREAFEGPGLRHRDQRPEGLQRRRHPQPPAPRRRANRL